MAFLVTISKKKQDQSFFCPFRPEAAESNATHCSSQHHNDEGWPVGNGHLQLECTKRSGCRRTWKEHCWVSAGPAFFMTASGFVFFGFVSCGFIVSSCCLSVFVSCFELFFCNHYDCFLLGQLSHTLMCPTFLHYILFIFIYIYIFPKTKKRVCLRGNAGYALAIRTRSSDAIPDQKTKRESR